MKVSRPMLIGLAVIGLSCGGAPVRSETPGGGRAGAGEGAGAGASSEATCVPAAEVEHPSYHSDTLHLELRQDAPVAGMVIPPLEFEVRVDEDLTRSVEMELTIHDPQGGTHVQRFHHSNMREQCDPYCDPAVGGPPCPPRRCWME